MGLSELVGEDVPSVLVGTIQSAASPDRANTEVKVVSLGAGTDFAAAALDIRSAPASLVCGLQDLHQWPPLGPEAFSVGLRVTPSTPLVLRPSDLNWTTKLPSPQGLQLADGLS